MSDPNVAVEEPDIELEPEEDDFLLEDDDPEVESNPEPESAAVAVPSVPALMQVLPADFPLPALIKFIPNAQFRVEAEQAATYALSLEVNGQEGLQRADLALTTLRAAQRAIEDHFADPIDIANKLHKGLTSTRSEWLSAGKSAVETVGRRVYTEQRRLEAIAADERRKAQAEADRIAREAARREAEEAEKAKAPETVVKELKRQAQTATAAPVAAAAPAALRGTSVVTTWKARPSGTSGADAPNPCTEEMSVAQAEQFMVLLRAIVDGKAPVCAVQPDWSYLNKRAKADKSTLQIPGVEAFEEGGTRAKGSRSK